MQGPSGNAVLWAWGKEESSFWRCANRGLVAISGSLFCLMLFGVGSGCAQDVAEAARQERARKQSQPRRATHVYTEEELTQQHILTPEDRARYATARKEWVPPSGWQLADVPAAGSLRAEVSLGEVARRFRQQKQARENPSFTGLPTITSTLALASPASPIRSLPARAVAKPVAKPDPGRRVKSVERVKPQATAEVRVKPGDSLWKLAQQYLGSGIRWRCIAAANPRLSDPSLIRVGEWIRVPDEVQSCRPQRAYRVNPRDSLWKIARAEWGSGRFWVCLAGANPELRNENLIYAGQTVLLPDHCGDDP